MTHTTFVDSYEVHDNPVLIFAITDESFNTNVFKLTVTSAGTIRIEKYMQNILYDFSYPSELVTRNMSANEIDDMIYQILLVCSKGEETNIHRCDSRVYCDFVDMVVELFK